jgi:hypothetical protein
MSTVTDHVKQSERYFYLDWMRLFAILVVFLFHNLKFYDYPGWHLKNIQQCEIATQITNFIFLWIMPFFFTISGASTTIFIRHRNFKQVVADRSKRLLLPYLFGIFVLIPPQKYFESLYHKISDGNLMNMFIGYFNVSNVKIGFSTIWFGYFGYHLWFLAFLFIITIIAYPILRWIRNGFINNKPSFFIKIAGKHSYIYTLCVPLLVIDFILRVPFPEYLNWADFFDFIYFFIFGFLIFSNKEIIETVKKNASRNLLIAIVFVLVLGYLAIFTDFIRAISASPAWTLQYFGFVSLLKLNAFFWTLALLGIGASGLNFSTKYLYRLNEFVLPFYMLHQTIIITIGFYIIVLEISIIEKFLIITLLSFISIVLIYLVIQRFNVLRFLFGMKIKTPHNNGS